jgi:GTPase
MAKQTLRAIDEADAIIFLTDGRAGLNAHDRDIAGRLRMAKAPVLLAVNKTEGMNAEVVTAEFHELGLGEPIAISATHGSGIKSLVELALEPFPVEPEDYEEPTHPKVAIVGRPNVGKSTLVNRLLGEERVIAFDQPGTTRDAIFVELERHGKPYTLIDTAGIRKRGKVFEAVEKFSVIKTLQAVEEANVVVLVLDARGEISDQDAHIAGFVLDAGRAVVIAINKWDNLAEEQRETIKRDFTRKLAFLDFADMHYISAKDGSGLTPLFKSVDKAFEAAMAKLSTPKLTRAMMAATTKHQPPLKGLHRPKMRYAHQGGTNPPVVVIHGTNISEMPESYRRYLEKTFSAHFELRGTPLRVEFRSTENPFAGRGNKPLTKAQQVAKRKDKIWAKKRYSA